MEASPNVAVVPLERASLRQAHAADNPHGEVDGLDTRVQRFDFGNSDAVGDGRRVWAATVPGERGIGDERSAAMVQEVDASDAGAYAWHFADRALA